MIVGLKLRRHRADEHRSIRAIELLRDVEETGGGETGRLHLVIG